MSTVILKGEEAIHYAELHGLTLNLYAEGDHPARTGLSVEEAKDIQHTHSGHLWVETKVAVNTGEPAPH